MIAKGELHASIDESGVVTFSEDPERHASQESLAKLSAANAAADRLGARLAASNDALAVDPAFLLKQMRQGRSFAEDDYDVNLGGWGH